MSFHLEKILNITVISEHFKKLISKTYVKGDHRSQAQGRVNTLEKQGSKNFTVSETKNLASISSIHKFLTSKLRHMKN